VQAQSTSAQRAGETRLDFSNKKDPFKPYASEPVAVPQKERPAVAARIGNLLPIQSFDVNKFTVSGIIIGLKENTALVIDPAGRGYVIKEGMMIGNSDGRISRIRSSSVEVVEPYRDDNGHIRKRTIMLTLKKK
jgi:type IV pilus assembly protein PilP